MSWQVTTTVESREGEDRGSVVLTWTQAVGDELSYTFRPLNLTKLMGDAAGLDKLKAEAERSRDAELSARTKESVNGTSLTDFMNQGDDAATFFAGAK